MRKLAWFLTFLVLTTPLLAQTKALLNLEKSGLALQGYDPVAFFTQNKPVKGKPEFKSTHQAATYYFASEENKEHFDKEPAKFEPAFGGFCAYGISRWPTLQVFSETLRFPATSLRQ